MPQKPAKSEITIDPELEKLLNPGDEYVDDSKKGTDEEGGEPGDSDTEDNEESGDDESGDEKNEEESKEIIPDEFEAIDPKKLPPELRGHFNKMLGKYTKAMENVRNVEKKAELWDYVTTNPQFFINKFSPTTETAERKGDESTVRPAEERFLKQLNLPEDNELTPAVKGLALMMLRGFGSVQESKQKDDENTTKDNIKKWVSTNKLTGDTELLKKMDEIGMENPNLYKNLDKLRKYAETELGRTAKKEKEKVREDVSKIYKDMESARKAKTPMPSKGLSKEAQVKKPKNIAEAFDMAVDQIKNANK